MLGVAAKDFKTIVTIIKDVKENVLLMNEKVTYFKEINTKKRNILERKNSIQTKILKN